MEPQLPLSIPLTIASLALFFICITALKYAVEDEFQRTRLSMTAFFIFIVTTLTIAFLPFARATLPFTAPAFIIGALVGYVAGVRAAQERLMLEGLEHYMEHFSHVHFSNFENFKWWSVINFYSIMSALLLINLVGFSSVIMHGSQSWAIATSTVGALLLGTIVPYLVHLWTIGAKRS